MITTTASATASRPENKDLTRQIELWKKEQAEKNKKQAEANSR